MFWIFFVLLVFSTGGCILISKIDNNILMGNISESLWNITQNQCICEMIQSNGIISTLNYFSTNETCQLFYTNFTSILIEFDLNSTLIFMNQSAIFIALTSSSITLTTTLSPSNTTMITTEPIIDTTEPSYECGNMTVLIGTDLVSGYLDFRQVQSFSECCTWCQSNSSCVSFTWDMPTGVGSIAWCYIRDHIPSPSVNPVVISARY
ncbi:unnamed protein product [Adineta steineri]|uniref:Apple domain-containing protein n=1 Tax=Adineta steineri TaxID=433720 RepID=A0A814BXU4_9BILA|nr:unnamed protein product [Adineta steineri]CAF1089459.1 unnamed protein product [Adineta steineri]